MMYGLMRPYLSIGSRKNVQKSVSHGLESIIQLMVKFSPIVNVVVENVSLQKSESEFLHFFTFQTK